MPKMGRSKLSQATLILYVTSNAGLCNHDLTVHVFFNRTQAKETF